MAEHITEDEQIEALKRWWKENGTSLVIGVVLAVGGYFGWQAWQSQQQEAREQASALYEDMLESGIADPGQQLSEQQLAKVNSIADELMSNYKSSLYAHNAALLLAKLAVENNDLVAAEERLRWVLDNGPEDSVEAVVNLRLAVVLYSQDKLDQALQLVSAAPDDSFTSRYAEVRGDIQLANGNQQDALTAYQAALDNLLQSQNSRRDMIQMKINDIEASIQDKAPMANSESSSEETTESVEASVEDGNQPVETAVETKQGQGE